MMSAQPPFKPFQTGCGTCKPIMRGGSATAMPAEYMGKPGRNDYMLLPPAHGTSGQQIESTFQEGGAKKKRTSTRRKSVTKKTTAKRSTSPKRRGSVTKKTTAKRPGSAKRRGSVTKKRPGSATKKRPTSAKKGLGRLRLSIFRRHRGGDRCEDEKCDRTHHMEGGKKGLVRRSLNTVKRGASAVVGTIVRTTRKATSAVARLAKSATTSKKTRKSSKSVRKSTGSKKVHSRRRGGADGNTMKMSGGMAELFGSDFLSVAGSRGNANSPSQAWLGPGEAAFRIFNKTGQYIPNEELKYMAAPISTGVEKDMFGIAGYSSPGMGAPISGR